MEISGIDLTTMHVDVEVIIPADIETVWDLLADLSRIGEWSPECVRVTWLEAVPGQRVGARFEGLNRVPGFEWSVTGQVIEAERPDTFAWIVFDDDSERVDRPSSTWRYELSAVNGGTLVRQSFRHGPGWSGVVLAIESEPGRAREVIEERCEDLRQNMHETLRGVAKAALTR